MTQDDEYKKFMCDRHGEDVFEEEQFEDCKKCGGFYSKKITKQDRRDYGEFIRKKELDEMSKNVVIKSTDTIPDVQLFEKKCREAREYYITINKWLQSKGVCFCNNPEDLE